MMSRKERIRVMSDLKLTIAAGPHDRRFTPLRVTVPVSGEACSAVLTPFSAAEPKKGAIPPPPIVGQLGPVADGKAELAFVLPWLAKNSRAVYAVAFSKEPASARAVLTTQPGGDVEITLQGERLGRYHTEAKWARPFLQPVMGPFGHSVTRGWPVEGRPGESEDHHHHKSLYVAHGDVNGVDNWSESTGHGREVQKQVLQCASGSVCAVLETLNDWVSNAGVKVCEDRRKWTFWAMPGGLRMFDLEVEFRASEGPLTFGDTKEGGILAVRVATTMDVPRTGLIENAEGGINEGETWGKRSAWCDYTGRDEGGNQVGIAILNHPLSFRYPTYWHVRNYGLMTANPFGLHDFYGDKKRSGSHTIGAGETLWFGYRVYVHPGDAEGGHVRDMFHGYANPPVVMVEA